MAVDDDVLGGLADREDEGRQDRGVVYVADPGQPVRDRVEGSEQIEERPCGHDLVALLDGWMRCVTEGLAGEAHQTPVGEPTELAGQALPKRGRHPGPGRGVQKALRNGDLRDAGGGSHCMLAQDYSRSQLRSLSLGL